MDCPSSSRGRHCVLGLPPDGRGSVDVGGGCRQWPVRRDCGRDDKPQAQLGHWRRECAGQRTGEQQEGESESAWQRVYVRVVCTCGC
jgi:hypothetical protein